MYWFSSDSIRLNDLKTWPPTLGFAAATSSYEPTLFAWNHECGGTYVDDASTTEVMLSRHHDHVVHTVLN
jgi:hypothetical protein